MFPSSLCHDTGRLLPTDRDVISPSADKTPSFGARTHLHYHTDHIRLLAGDIHENPHFPGRKSCADPTITNTCVRAVPDPRRWLDDDSWGNWPRPHIPPVARLYDGMGVPPYSDITACLASLDCSLGPKWKRCSRRCFSGDARAQTGSLSIRRLWACSIFWN